MKDAMGKHGYGAKTPPNASGSTGGGKIKKVAQSDQRADSTAKVSNKLPFPRGMA